ncbi:MAG: alcohol dehydrogenase catalytic domain-containing protein [Anaerolineae bacterium]
MRALVFDGRLWLDRQCPQPIIKLGENLLRIRKAGICNTDLELVAGMYGFSGVLGHEFVADVVEGAEEFVGKRVVGEISVVCGQCDFCHRGIPSQCRNRDTVGIRRYPGAFSDYLVLPSRNLHIVPDSVTDNEAVFAEPLAAALQVTEAIHISPRNRVIVLGMGKLGMLIAQILKLTGAEVVGVTKRAKQVDLLEKWGIQPAARGDLSDQSAPVIVDVTGDPSGFADALALVESRGTVVLKSTYHGLPQTDLTQIAVREIRVVGSRCGPFDAALRLLKHKLVDVNTLIEGTYSIEDSLSAMEHAAQQGALKILLDF